MVTPSAATAAIRNRGIAAVVTAARYAINRFPLVVAAGIAAAAGASVMVESGHHPDAIRVLATATLALPLLFMITVLAGNRPRSRIHWVLLVLGLIGLAAFWRTWPHWTDEMRALRYVQLSASFHLLAAFAPFMGAAGTNGFWQFNKTLFLRALMAAIYTGVLYVGLAIALAAINKLFGVPLPSATYPRLWFVLAFVFSTMIFVGGVPDDLDALAAQTDYPNGLRAFTQFVLVPLVAIYLGILTLYLVKVLITQQWPSGWIGYLVSSVAVAGILSWLLVHPLEERPEFAWVKPFTKGFYIALMPAIVMLWLAASKRVHQYGITEPRYALIVLSIWLAAIAVYFTFSRSRNIKLIPASLCLITLGSFAGPTGMYSVSRSSQMRRLRTVLERDSLLVGGQLRRAARDVADSDRVAISAGFQYLTEVHGYRAVAAWLPDSLAKSLAVTSDTAQDPSADREARAIMAIMNVAYTPGARGAPVKGGGTYVYFSASNPRPAVPIAGFTHAVHVLATSYPKDSIYPNDSITVDARTWVRVSRPDATLQVMRAGASLLDIPLQAAIDSAVAAPRTGVNVPAHEQALRIEAVRDGVTAALYITQASGTEKDGRMRLMMLGAELYLRVP